PAREGTFCTIWIGIGGLQQWRVAGLGAKWRSRSGGIQHLPLDFIEWAIHQTQLQLAGRFGLRGHECRNRHHLFLSRVLRECRWTAVWSGWCYWHQDTDSTASARCVVALIHPDAEQS